MKPSMIGFNPCPVSPAGQIDQQLDTAYDAVKEVRDNIDKIQYLYDLLKNENRLNVITYKDPDFVITGNHNNHLIINDSAVDNVYHLGSTNVTIDGEVTSGIGAQVLITTKSNKKITFKPLEGITILNKSGTVLEVERTNDLVGFIAVSPNSWLLVSEETAKSIFNQLLGDLNKLIKDSILTELKLLGFDRIEDGRMIAVQQIIGVIDSFNNKAFIKDVKFALEKEGQLRAGQITEINAANRAVIERLDIAETDLKGNSKVISEVKGRVENPETGLSAAYGLSQKALITSQGLAESTTKIDNSLKDVINKVAATALFVQSVSNKLDGTVNSLFELSGKVIDGRTGLEATRIFAQSARTLVDGAVESITVLENRASTLDNKVEAAANLAMNTKVTVDGLAVSNLNLGVRVTNTESGVQAAAGLAQSAQATADGAAEANQELSVRVGNTEQTLSATSGLLQQVKLTADNALVATGELSTSVNDLERDLAGTTSLAQQAKTTADGAVNANQTLTTRVKTAEDNIVAASQLAQNAKTTADGAVNATQTLSTTVNNATTGLAATNSLAQSARVTANGAAESVQTLEGRVNNATTGLAATFTLAQQAKTTADGASQSATNITNRLDNPSTGLAAAVSFSQSAIQTADSARNTADTALQATSTLNTSVQNLGGRIGNAELTLQSTVNTVGDINSRAFIKTSSVSNGVATVTSLSVGGFDNAFRFQGGTISFTDLNGTQQMFFNPSINSWVFGGSLIAATFQTAQGGFRAEMSGTGQFPFWYGAGDKNSANARLSLDTGGNVQLRNAKIEFVGSHFMRIEGVDPFGPDSLISWYGKRIDWVNYNPNTGELISSGLRKNNATTFITVDGTYFFNGTIISGVRKNSAQTTLYGNTIVQLGPFGSAGGPIVIRCGIYAFSSYFSAGSCPTNLSNPSARLILERLEGANFITVAQHIVTGRAEAFQESGECLLNFWIDGGFSHEDTQRVAANRTYRLSVQWLTGIPQLGWGNSSQSLSIVSEE